jgi:hypothetical protein
MKIATLLTAVALAALAATPARAAIDLSPGDIKITHLQLTNPGAAQWSFEFGLLKTDTPLPPEAALLRAELRDRAVLRPLHGGGSVAGAAGQQRFTVPPTSPGGNPLFRQGSAFVSLDAQDPDWDQIATFSRARLSVAISISGHVVAADGTPVSPPLTDEAVARGSATVRIPRSVLAAHR